MQACMEYNKLLSIEEKQKISLEILTFFHNYCEKNGLTYYLAYGTLLGAVRHRGFIPWDDDVDVHIPRHDYDKLLKCFHDPSGRFEIISSSTKNWYVLPFAKLQDTKTKKITEDGQINDQYFGIGIDLFPLDGIPDDLEAANKAFRRKNQEFLKVLWRLDTYRRIDKASSITEMIKHLIGSMLFSTGLLSKEAEKLSRSPYSVDYDEANKLACVVGIHSGRFCPFDKKWFEKTELRFEGRSFLAPKGYHEILSLIYGDYMTPPDENHRFSNHADQYVLID